MLPVIVITGPVGVGKSTVARALSEKLEHQNISHALIDMDWLRWLYPAKPEDRFRVKLGHKNLACLAENYRAEGAKLLLLADVLESSEDYRAYLEAIPAARLTVVRLKADIATIHKRLRDRESAETLSWYKARALELSDLMEARQIGDMVVDSADMTASQISEVVWQNLSARLSL
ncbi:MAG: AAA family ATPase [Trueperaceae bacterium]|nr:AAA family ATPase [Trueperaceae bacterium]